MTPRIASRCCTVLLSILLIACGSAGGSTEPTATAPFLPPTWTPQEAAFDEPSPTFVRLTMTMTATRTEVPSQTPLPTSTNTPLPPTATFTPTMTYTPSATPTPCPAVCPTPTPTPTLPTRTPRPGTLNGLQVGFAPIATGLNKPVGMAVVPGLNLMAVIFQPGQIHLIENGQVVQPALLDLSEKVNDVDVEMGLLGIAFHPNAASNGAMYVDYTDFEGNIVVERYTLNPDRRTADPASASTVIKIRHTGIQHNGGHLAFGPDGMLYISVGDGGGKGGDQMLPGGPGSVLLGSILRIDVNTAPYVIPDGNPFVNTASPPELWHIGLRNPWRFSFDRRTEEMYIGDVGEGVWEEINFVPARRGGLNFGWPVFEGRECYGGGTDCSGAGLTMPIAVHGHDEGCSVTGGYVYRGSAYPWMTGIYFYSDFCTGAIWGMIRSGGVWVKQKLIGSDMQVSSFGEDANGELYVLDYGRGRLLQLTGP